VQSSEDSAILSPEFKDGFENNLIILIILFDGRAEKELVQWNEDYATAWWQ
jgi:hypothetical protein